MCQTCTRPLSVSDARMPARIMEAVWVAITRRWRLTRSAMIPPKGATRKTGIWLAKPTLPSNRAETVRR